MFEKYSDNQKKRILAALKQGNFYNKTVLDCLLESDSLLQYLTIDDYIVFMKMILEYIDNYPDELKKYLDKNPKVQYVLNHNKIYIPDVSQENIILEWENVTPYTILGIEEKEYTEEELLKIIGNKIKLINKKNKETKEEDINIILDAYNEITKTYNKKR